ncbi:MAG: hypothetical protein ACKVQC_06750 [Elusimicrobiota bacterium]
MSAYKIKTGGRYITATGIPVRIISVTNKAILLKSLQSDNRFSVSAGYPLRASKENREVVTNMSQESAASARPLAPLIDAMLLKGGMTMRGIVRELKRRASASCNGRDVAANVRARVYWLKRRGYRPERDSREKLKVTRPNN